MPRKPALVANAQRRWHRNHGAYYFARVLNSRGVMVACDVTEYATPEQALSAARALVAAYGKPAVVVKPAKPRETIAWALKFLCAGPLPPFGAVEILYRLDLHYANREQERAQLAAGLALAS